MRASHLQNILVTTSPEEPSFECESGNQYYSDVILFVTQNRLVDFEPVVCSQATKFNSSPIYLAIKYMSFKTSRL